MVHSLCNTELHKVHCKKKNGFMRFISTLPKSQFVQFIKPASLYSRYKKKFRKLEIFRRLAEEKSLFKDDIKIRYMHKYWSKKLIWSFLILEVETK